jgi:hypothetical protein
MDISERTRWLHGKLEDMLANRTLLLVQCIRSQCDDTWLQDVLGTGVQQGTAKRPLLALLLSIGTSKSKVWRAPH